jgi:hypothetical protein
MDTEVSILARLPDEQQAASRKRQAKKFDMKDFIGYIVCMQARSAAQCEQPGSGSYTMIKPGLQVGPGLPSSLVLFFIQGGKLQATSNKRQAPSGKLQAASHERQAP